MASTTKILSWKEKKNSQQDKRAIDFIQYLKEESPEYSQT